MDNDIAQSSADDVFGERVHHRPVIFPVCSFRGAAVIEHPAERERGAEAFVQHEEELRRGVGPPVGEHVQENFERRVVLL